MYYQSQHQKDKLEFKKQQINNEVNANANQVFTQDKTNRLIEKRKIEKFQQIFKLLDSDGDGYISA